MEIQQYEQQIRESLSKFLTNNNDEIMTQLVNQIVVMIRDDDIDNSEKIQLLGLLTREISINLQNRFDNLVRYIEMLDRSNFNRLYKPSVGLTYFKNRIAALADIPISQRLPYIINICEAIRMYNERFADNVRNFIEGEIKRVRDYSEEMRILYALEKIIERNEANHTPDNIAQEINDRFPRIIVRGLTKVMRKIMAMVELIRRIVNYKKGLNELCKNVKGWDHKKREGYNEEYFIGEVKRIIGWVKSRRDKVLLERFMGTKYAYRLSMIIDEHNFIEQMLVTLQKGIRTGNWEGFYGKDGLVYNMPKGRRYIKKVREEFRNENLAKLLEQLTNELGESQPNVWYERIFDYLQTEYRYDENIVSLASSELQNLFTGRIEELSKKDEQEIVKDLRSYLIKNLRRVKKKEESIARDIEKLIKKEENRLTAILRREYFELYNLVNNNRIYELYTGFFTEFANFSENLAKERTSEIEKLKQTLARGKTINRQFLQLMKPTTLVNNPRMEAALTFASTQYFHALLDTVFQCEDSETRLLLFTIENTEKCFNIFKKGLELCLKLNNVLDHIKRKNGEFDLITFGSYRTGEERLEKAA